MLTFNGAIDGTHGPVTMEPPLLHSKIVKFWGVNGETELRGGRGGRILECRIWLHNGYSTYRALGRELESLDRRVGTHGTLTIRGNGGYQRQFRNCTFLGFTPDGLPGSGPVRDVAGTLDGGWWIAGTLRWRQLRDY